MTPPEKPEWIEIADTDNAASPRKISKKLPALALIITATIIGAGAVFGQTSNENPASAIQTAAPVVQSVGLSQPVETNTLPSSPSSPSVITSASKERIAPATLSSSIESSAPPATTQTAPTTSPIKNPSIGTLPTKGGDDSHGVSVESDVESEND